MTEEKLTLEIKDNFSLAENLGFFSDALKKLDAELGVVLSEELGSMSTGKKVDRDALWNALYAATEPAPEDEDQ